MAKAGDGSCLSVSFINLEGVTLASWTGSSTATVGEVKKSVADQIGKHAIRVGMVWQSEKLLDGDSLQEKAIMDQANVQIVIDDSIAEQKWEELKTKCGELDYGLTQRMSTNWQLNAWRLACILLETFPKLCETLAKKLVV